MAATLFARRWVFLAFLLAALQLSGCAGVQRGWDAALLLADLQAAGGDSMLKRRTPAPHVTPLQYTIAGHAQVADRYAGPDASRGTLVLIHGFTEAGRRDVRMVQFAESLARSGFVVLAPELPGMTDMSVGSAEREEIATALRHATGHGRAGLVALSLAAGPAIHAAMKPDLADRVAYILLIGGYHDIVDVIRYATTGVDAATGETADLREPVQQGKWMLLRAQLRNLEDPQDHAALEAIANARTQDPAAPVDRWLAQLTPDGRAVFALIENTDPQRVDALVAALPQRVREELAALDLARHDLGALRAQLLLVHGAADPVIPLSQSKRLAGALPEGQVELFIPPDLSHVDLDPGLRDAWHLWRATTRLLAHAEASR